jgi:hypothetical protein
MKFWFAVLRIIVWFINMALLAVLWVSLEQKGILLGPIPKVYMFFGMMYFAKLECKYLRARKHNEDDK